MKNLEKSGDGVYLQRDVRIIFRMEAENMRLLLVGIKINCLTQNQTITKKAKINLNLLFSQHAQSPTSQITIKPSLLYS